MISDTEQMPETETQKPQCERDSDKDDVKDVGPAWLSKSQCYIEVPRQVA